MYKLLLCWRYLRTRYLALVCIASVMLGVATLIVVNSVMTGFSTKLRSRLHDMLADIDMESVDYGGFGDPEAKMALIRTDPFLAKRIEAMTPNQEIFAMLQFTVNGATIVKTVRLIGIDPEGRARMGGFTEHLVRAAKSGAAPSFDLDEEGKQHYAEQHPAPLPRIKPLLGADGLPEPDAPPSRPPGLPEGTILGWAIAHYRDPQTNKDIEVLKSGDDVVVTTISGEQLRPVSYRYVVSDYFRSEMSECDSQYVFVPLEHLQQLRAMDDRVTGIQIRLKDYNRDAKEVKKRLQALFANQAIYVQTWEDKQGPLLAAIDIERGILNIILFMIVGVAGFGILAIFSMIVVEKTRDIGILKAMGASNGGVLKIFLGYGLLLGVVGAVFGSALGVTITVFINEIENFITYTTGHEIFNRSVYYFDKIPTDIQPLSVLLLNLGAVGIAVVFSILPALRAALLHPVRALRYE